MSRLRLRTVRCCHYTVYSTPKKNAQTRRGSIDYAHAYPSVCTAIPESAPSCKQLHSRIAPLFQELWSFPHENVVRFAELRCIEKNRGAFGKKCRGTLPAQIQRQSIKMWRISYQKAPHKIFISVAFFLTYSVCLATPGDQKASCTIYTDI